MSKIDMLNIALWLLFYCGFIGGIVLILQGWRRHKEKPEALRLWHIFSPKKNRENGINWMIEGLFVVVSSLWYLYFLLFLYR